MKKSSFISCCMIGMLIMGMSCKTNQQVVKNKFQPLPNACVLLDSMQHTPEYNYQELKKRTLFRYFPVENPRSDSINAVLIAQGYRVVVENIDPYRDSIIVYSLCEDAALRIYKKRFYAAIPQKGRKADSLYRLSLSPFPSCFRFSTFYP